MTGTATTTEATLYSTVEEWRARPTAADRRLLDLPLGTVGKVQSIEWSRSFSEVLVTSEVEIIANQGKGWYSARVISADSPHGVFRDRRLIWGGELVTT